MRDDIQEKVAAHWLQASTETLPELGDLAGYKNDFLNLFGFGIAGVDYGEDISEIVEIEGV